jgi:hypothetical protein
MECGVDLFILDDGDGERREKKIDVGRYFAILAGR